jgi:hypothetical protein
MKLHAAALFAFAVYAALPNQAASPPQAASPQQAASPRATLQQELGFEQQTGPELKDWNVHPTGSATADNQVAHSGKWSARLQRTPQSEGEAAAITRAIPIDFSGQTVELRGYLRLKDVAGWTGFWVREDAEGSPVEFDNMQSRAVNGTRDWTEYRITLPLNPKADKLFFGALLVGNGSVWADDLELLVDGKPIADAKAGQPTPGLPADHEFDAGSSISPAALTPVQVDNLATLARVWGFLKYHHPTLTAGQRHWDYELFRIMPAILAAPDRSAANAALSAWVDKLGPVPACKPCATLPPADYDLKPPLDWIRDTVTLGSGLSSKLQHIYESRTGNQFFVSMAKGIENPVFDHEPRYSSIHFPDAGYQLLALFRWWNIVQYWTPGRNVAGPNVSGPSSSSLKVSSQDWPAVLHTFIPTLALAKDKDAYQLALFELIGTLNDGHANLWSSLAVRPPVGSCWLPVSVRWVENQPVVWQVATPDAPFKLGDIIDKLDGVAVSDLFKQWSPYYADSNQPARLRDLTAHMTRGACAPVTVDLTRAGKPMHVDAKRLDNLPHASHWHDQPGDTFRLLSPDVAYIKLSTIKAADVPGYFEKAKHTKGVIIDIRNYPSEFMPFVMGPILADKPTQFASFTRIDLANPGASSFHTGDEIRPGTQHYTGKIVVLVDELSVSQAEYTAMALKAMPNTVILGSTTAGADGNVSEIPLPGNLNTMVSGLGVFYPDHNPTQRIGILPDVVATPTVEGIAAGRDELLERAVTLIQLSK